MSESPAIYIENAVLDFPVSKSSGALIKEIFIRRANVKSKNFYRAVDNVNLSIKKGEVVGLIGPNGAGKSTLLRMMAGIYAPDKGKVVINGKVSLLAGLGAGFQKNLTGRENIYLAGSIYGIESENLRSLVPSIVVFSGIGDFIDRPIRTYSSGMRARLAFSIASALSPEILLIDEVMSVGDSAFREKSKNRILEMVKSDATVVIVSHNAQILRDICDRIICLSKGKVDLDTDQPKEAILRYRELSEAV